MYARKHVHPKTTYPRRPHYEIQRLKTFGSYLWLDVLYLASICCPHTVDIP